MPQADELLSLVKEGFKTLKVSEKYKTESLKNLHTWLTDPQFESYRPQIEHMIAKGYWDYLLDSFYQIIPFGTGGRRGEVGIGPNRINPWTIKSASQGYSQFLLNMYKDQTAQRGVVIAYDVRQFTSNQYFNDELPNPVRNLTCKDLAIAAAEVYAGNGIKVYLFDDVRSTPELSFAIRHLKAVGGNVISASHNPPEHNGQKVYDEFGGQLIPPFDEQLVKEVTDNVTKIQELSIEEAKNKQLIQMIGKEVDQTYIDAVLKISQNNYRDLSIVYTPLHGTGTTNLYAVLTAAGFTLNKDPQTSFPSGKFENVTFNIPNPEVEQSFETSLKYAKEKNADLLISSDPDSDRFGVMVHHHNDWVFLNGNEIASILVEYLVQKYKQNSSKKGVVIKTGVTTNLIREICQKNNVDLIGDLLVGFKYVGDEMNKLENTGRIDEFLFGGEESHSYIIGNYTREKDAAAGAFIFAEIAAELKTKDQTVIDYLNNIYAKYGYFRNYLTEVRLPGAEGKAQIDKIQEGLRTFKGNKIGNFEVENVVDYLDQKPYLSTTDEAAKNILVYNFKPVEGTISIKVTIRPSGTEPKSKMYFEIGSEPFSIEKLSSIRDQIETIRKELEKDFMKFCYSIIGIEFPDRGFLLFWQLPLTSKLKYFEIEDQIVKLKDVTDLQTRKEELNQLLKFLGSNPIEKVDNAFKAKYNESINTFLNLS